MSKCFIFNQLLVTPTDHKIDPTAMTKNILQRLERLDHLIHIKATGTPKKLADKLNICAT